MSDRDPETRNLGEQEHRSFQHKMFRKINNLNTSIKFIYEKTNSYENTVGIGRFSEGYVKFRIACKVAVVVTNPVDSPYLKAI